MSKNAYLFIFQHQVRTEGSFVATCPLSYFALCRALNESYLAGSPFSSVENMNFTWGMHTPHGRLPTKKEFWEQVKNYFYQDFERGCEGWRPSEYPSNHCPVFWNLYVLPPII